MSPRPQGSSRPPALAVVAFVSLVACADDTLWVDPDVTLAAQSDASRGPSALAIGYGEGLSFAPLTTVTPIPVVDGLQGGTWTMPTLRAHTLSASLLTECTLTTSSGERLGQTSAQIPTRPTPSATGPHSGPGWVELARLPIPVFRAAANATAPLSELDGAPTTLACSVTAAGETATTSVTAPLSVPPP